RASRNFRTGCIYVLSSFAPISTFSISCFCKEVLAQPCKTESPGFRNTHCINRNWWLDLDTARKARTDFIDHPFNRPSDSLPLSRLALPPAFCYRKDRDQPGTPMTSFALPHPSRNLLAPFAVVTAAVIALALASPSLAADEPDVPKDGGKGATVTVLKAAKFCFPAIVEASGIIIPREETMVRPDRPGLKVAEILAEPGDTVTAGQNLARLNLPE